MQILINSAVESELITNRLPGRKLKNPPSSRNRPPGKSKHKHTVSNPDPTHPCQTDPCLRFTPEKGNSTNPEAATEGCEVTKTSRSGQEKPFKERQEEILSCKLLGFRADPPPLNLFGKLKPQRGTAGVRWSGVGWGRGMAPVRPTVPAVCGRGGGEVLLPFTALLGSKGERCGRETQKEAVISACSCHRYTCVDGAFFDLVM